MAYSGCWGCFQFLAQRPKQIAEPPIPSVSDGQQPPRNMPTRVLAFLSPGRIFGVSSISRCCRFVGESATNTQGQDHKELARDIAELNTQGYRAIGVKRAQDAVRQWDPFRMHGFIILHLRGPWGEEKYLRIDWCEDGLHKQLVDSESDLEDYVARSLAVPASAGAVASGLAVGAWVQGAGVGGFLAAPAFSFWPITIVAGTSIIVAGSVVILFLPMIWAETSNYLASYSPPQVSDRAMTQLYEFVMLHRQKKYSLTDWNCNHFADGAFQCLQTLPDPPNISNEVIRMTSYRGWPKMVTGMTEEWLLTKTGSEEEVVSLAKDEVSRDPVGCLIEVSWWFTFTGGYWAAKRFVVSNPSDLQFERGYGYGYMVFHKDLQVPQE